MALALALAWLSSHGEASKSRGLRERDRDEANRAYERAEATNENRDLGYLPSGGTKYSNPGHAKRQPSDPPGRLSSWHIHEGNVGAGARKP
uniref:OO_Ba0005L10-OO_Ba0081K17.3 protein n=1 Tax=Oryza officinalis TaxID=4535 RepID=D0ABC9_9ORYZ|nr:OO_Ba0005L10-OO_Ba0081K17.3 [Oryza officinalis]